MLLQTLDGYIAKPFSPCKLFRNVLHVSAHTQGQDKHNQEYNLVLLHEANY